MLCLICALAGKIDPDTTAKNLKAAIWDLEL